MQIFCDESVPLAKRVIARETVAVALAPALKDHPLFTTLAVLVSCDARRGGWQVTLVPLDSGLRWEASSVSVAPAVLHDVREALARL